MLCSRSRPVDERFHLRRTVQKYASNNNAYLKDLSEAYQRLTTLGFQGTTRNS